MRKIVNFTLAAIAFGLVITAGAQAQTTQQTRGKQVFDLWCSACHKPLKPGDTPVAGTSSLARNYKGADPAIPAALEERRDLQPEYVKYLVRHGLKSMPFSRRVEISDADLDALAAYLTRNNPK